MTFFAALDEPQGPTGPTGPQTAGSTSVLEDTRTEEQRAPGDNERYAHYVRKDRIAASAVTGQPVVALCGKVWIPLRDPSGFPICPICQEIHRSGGNQGPGWPFSGGSGGNGAGGSGEGGE